MNNYWVLFMANMNIARRNAGYNYMYIIIYIPNNIHNEKMRTRALDELVIRPLILSTKSHVQYVLAIFPNYR